MQTLLNVILPVFIVIGFGYIAVWRGLLTEVGIDALMKFTQSFAIPCLLFSAMARLDLAAGFDPRLLASFYLGAAICFFLGFFGARLFFGRDWEDCVVIGFCSLFSNSVLLGLPITERAYGIDALTGNYAIVAFHSPFGYALGIIAMEIARSRGASPLATARAAASAMFRNALVIAIALGLIVNLTGVPIPVVVEDALDLVIRAALPTALFALGGVLIRYRPEGDAKAIAMVCAISLLVHPALVWLVGAALSLPQGAMRSGVITAAMAPGVNAYIFASMYGRAKRVAASSVLAATGLTILTAWFWLHILG
ncbi:AEC family transporter [Sulfitobacter sp. D35]|uniref:AEC family transporter n=1 Tax=Sulfitobacter sp. D35 TaxID=3083252 RepID=UPI00296F958C|nr:AEC family transporter [Sulfitobacter sp. D35]MDW4499443.1 AEC family transporter [Sulfitobacter sp. D35]